jgi:hypothetical protein
MANKQFPGYLEYMQSLPRQEAPPERKRPSAKDRWPYLKAARETFSGVVAADKASSAMALRAQEEMNELNALLNTAHAEKRNILETLEGDALSEGLSKINAGIEALEYRRAKKAREGSEGKPSAHDELRNARGMVNTAEAAFYQAVLEDLRIALPRVKEVRWALAAARRANWAGSAPTIMAELFRVYADPMETEAVSKEIEAAYEKGGGQ